MNERPQPNDARSGMEKISAGLIASIESFHLSVPAQYGGPPPRGPRQWPNVEMLALRIETDSGIVGWGEAFGHKACATTKMALDTLIAPLCLGAEAGDIVGLSDKLTRALYAYGLGSTVAYALSGIDIALWDIRGKAAGRAVHQLLGSGVKNATLPAYASLLRYGDADMVGEATADAVARGHRQVKLHEETVEAVKAARAAAGDNIELMLDVNCRWPHDQAVPMARSLMAYNLRWIEEPCWPPDPNVYMRMKRESGIPIAAGENAIDFDGVAVLCTSGAVDLVQPSAAKIGGLSGLLRVSELVQKRDTRIATHSAYFGPGLAATIQFCVGTHLPGCEWYDIRLEHNPFDLKPENGALAVSDEPGLGMRVDEAAISHYQVRP